MSAVLLLPIGEETHPIRCPDAMRRPLAIYLTEAVAKHRRVGKPIVAPRAWASKVVTPLVSRWEQGEAESVKAEMREWLKTWGAFQRPEPLRNLLRRRTAYNLDEMCRVLAYGCEVMTDSGRSISLNALREVLGHKVLAHDACAVCAAAEADDWEEVARLTRTPLYTLRNLYSNVAEALRLPDPDPYGDEDPDDVF